LLRIHWRASEANETLLWVYQFEICDIGIRECASTLYLGLIIPFPLV